MPKILINILPAKGHFYGSLKIVLAFKKAGFDLVYLNMKPLRTEIKKYGFRKLMLKKGLIKLCEL